MSITFVFAPNTIIRSAQMNTNLLQDIRDKYNASLDGTTGHGHTGAIGDGPKINLTTSVTGILPIANGGSGTSTVFTTGSVIFAGASGIFSQDNANFFWDDTTNTLKLGGDLTIASTKKVFLDGGGDTFLFEETANSIAFFSKGIKALVIDNDASVKMHETQGSFAVDSTFGLFLDGGGNTFFQEVSADIPIGVAGGTEYFRGKSTGEILFPAVDPPTANYANRNSIVKASGTFDGTGATISSYNCTASLISNPGVYHVTWTTPFASANYTVVASATGNAHFATINAYLSNLVVIEIWDDAGNLVNDNFQIIAVGTQ